MSASSSPGRTDAEEDESVHIEACHTQQPEEREEKRRAGWNGTWKEREGEGGKADGASEPRESEIPVGMVPVICVMVPGL